MKNKIYFCIFILVCAIAFLAQDWWFISDFDDVYYSFIVPSYDADYFSLFEKVPHDYVQTWGDVFHSQYNHYLGSNGRIISPIFELACASFMTPHEYAVANTFMFALLLIIATYLCDNSLKLKSGLLFVITLCVFAPRTISVFLANMSISLNYLWVSVFAFSWYILYEYVKKREKTLSIPKLILIALYGIITSVQQESFSIGFCAGLGIYHLFNIKKLNTNIIVTIGAFFLGTLISILSPSNFSKAESSLRGFRPEVILDMMDSYAIPILIILIAIFYRHSKKDTINFIKENSVLLIAILFGVFFAVCMFYTSWHQFTMPVVASIILIIRLCKVIPFKGKHTISYLYLGLGIIFTLSIYPRTYELRKNLGTAYYSTVNEAKKKHSKIIIDTDYEIACKEIEDSWLNKYIRYNNINILNTLSIIISEGKDLKYITAVLPVTLEELCKKCKGNDICQLYNHIYACRLDSKYDNKNVIWNYQASFNNPRKLHNLQLQPDYCLAHNGNFYYIFGNYSKNFISKGITIEHN